MAVMTGSDAVVQSLIAEGIDLVFGIPGYHSEHLYGRLMRQDKVRHVLVRHEQGAGYMAIGAARVTGKPATILSTAGPGALNAATPMGEAYGDGIPLLNIMAEDMSAYLYQDRGIVHESKDQFGVFSRSEPVEPSGHVAGRDSGRHPRGTAPHARQPPSACSRRSPG